MCPLRQGGLVTGLPAEHSQRNPGDNGEDELPGDLPPLARNPPRHQNRHEAAALGSTIQARSRATAQPGSATAQRGPSQESPNEPPAHATLNAAHRTKS